MFKKICLCAILIVGFQTAFSHSGGTDRKGGHWDRVTGEYHFHHGHGPHQHPNGKCELKHREYPAPIPYTRTDTDEDDDSDHTWLVWVLGIGAGYLISNNRKSKY